MNTDNILLSSLNIDNLPQRVLCGTTSVDLIKRDDFDKLVSKCEVSFYEKEQDKIFSIVEDRYITEDEIMSLSYEQVKKLKELIIEDDENGNPYDASLINYNCKVASFAATSLVSDNEDFNKAVFEKLKTLDEKQCIILMVVLTGCYHIQGAAAFYEAGESSDFSKIKENDMEKYLKDRIKYCKGMLDQGLPKLAYDSYKEILSWYEDIYKNYSSIKKLREEQVAQIIRNNRPNPLEILKSKTI